MPKSLTARASRFRLMLGLAALLLVSATTTGCALLGYMAHAAAEQKTVEVLAQYQGLENKTVAVLVSADDYTLFRYPDITLQTCRAVSARLASGVPGITVADPGQMQRYQKENPYWTTVRYSKLIEEFKVDRLMIIDISDYRTHEPGNAHLWKGYMSASVAVVEADAADPDDFAFQTTMQAVYPRGSEVGLVNSDRKTMQIGLLNHFSRETSWLFYDHEEQPYKKQED